MAVHIKKISLVHVWEIQYVHLYALFITSSLFLINQSIRKKSYHNYHLHEVYQSVQYYYFDRG